MVRTRILVAATMLLLVIGSVPAAAAEPAPQPVGNADALLDLLSLEVNGLPVELLNTSLGAVHSFASTDTNPAINALGQGRPFSTAEVLLPGGQTIAARSDGATRQAGQNVDLAGAGSLSLGNLLAVADGSQARSLVDALTGTVNALLANLQVGVPQNGVQTVVDAAQSSATNGAVLEDFSLELGDLLPADLLALLPLETLLDLINNLGLDLGGLGLELEGLVGQLTGLLGGLGELDNVLGTVQGLADQLLDTNGTLGEAEALVDQITALIDALGQGDAGAVQGVVQQVQAILDGLTGGLLGGAAGNLLPFQQATTGLEDVIATVEGVLGQIGSGNPTALISTLTGALDDLLDTGGVIDSLTSLLGDLTASLDGVLGTLTGLLDGVLGILGDLPALGDLQGLLDGLLDGLLNQTLLGLDRFAVGTTSLASADSSEATALCDVGALTILTQTVDLGDCGGLSEGLLGLVPVVNGLLGSLPLAGILPADLVSVTGPQVSTTEPNTSENGYMTAGAAVEGLQLRIGSVDLARVTDGLVGSLLDTVEGLLPVLDLDGLGLLDLQGLGLADLGGLSGLLGNLDGLLGNLDGLLGQLPLGDLLGGLTTPNLGLKALDMTSVSSFAAAGTAPQQVTPPAQTAPTTPQPGQALPTTGGGFGLLAVLTLGMGGALALWLRRRPV